ncbi:hypothetical protein ACVWXO_002351 [Bradyrhizobium sp. LM2.7]
MRQKKQIELNLGTGARGEAPKAAAQATEARAAKASLERPAVAGPLMEAVVERENLKEALARVKRNKGAAGVDGMTVGDLPAYLKEHWLTIRAQLLDGTYKPQPVRRVEIPKASGGLRPLGIPTVLDRLIQQAVMQVLQADWDGTFSETSFGFRPKRSAHQAVEQAQAYIASGHGFVVDIRAGAAHFPVRRLDNFPGREIVLPQVHHGGAGGGRRVRQTVHLQRRIAAAGTARRIGRRRRRSANPAARLAARHRVLPGLHLVRHCRGRFNHDILMGLVAKRVADKRLLKLIRGFLTAGVLEGGLVSATEEGTPQGGPLSPLLST